MHDIELYDNKFRLLGITQVNEATWEQLAYVDYITVDPRYKLTSDIQSAHSISAQRAMQDLVDNALLSILR